jgi:hypothetical protein
MLAPEKIADMRLKQLEMIQGIIARMATYSVTLKNYCITLTTAVCGLAISLQRPLVVLLAMLPIVVFASLDAQYLRMERRFRALFDNVRQENWEQMPNLEININRIPSPSLRRVIFSWSISSFYLSLMAGVFIVIAILGIINGRII